jgi:phosphohistidine swiveling domain-containing protein
MCFVIHGEDMTRMIRDRLLEDTPGAAYRLATCVVDTDTGDPAEQVALRLLKGEVKLTGDSTNGITVEPEDPAVMETHQAAVRRLFAGRLRVNNLWYRPIACVTDVGRNDLRNDHNKRVYTLSAGGMVNREWHYASPTEIVVDCAGERNSIIFEPCGELPHWMVPPRDGAAALVEWRAVGRSLEERSHSLWYPPEPTWAAESDARAEEDEDAVRQLREQEEDEANARYESERDAEFAEYERAIVAQAGDDFIELSWPASDHADAEERERLASWGLQPEPYPAATVRVPRVPFVRWAIDRYPRLRHMEPAWTNVCPSGLKLTMDSRDHSDWMLGAGLGHVIRGGRYTTHPSYKAAMALMSEVLVDYGARCDDGVVVLSPGHRAITSRVVHGKPNIPAPAGSIVVLPDLRPAYLITIKDAAAVLTQEGGAAAHLANVGREQSLAILRVPGVFLRFQPGDRVTVDAENGRVRLANEANEEDGDEDEAIDD